MTIKPWGHERIVARTNDYVVKEIYVKPNSKLSLQYHNEKVETMFLIDGKGWVETRDYKGRKSTTLMEKFFPFYIKKKRIHRLFTTTEDCLVVEVSSCELDDIVRLEDDYGRA